MNFVAVEDRTCVTCPEPPAAIVSVPGVSTRLAMCSHHGAELLAEGVANYVVSIEAVGEAPHILYGRVSDYGGRDS